MSTSTHRRSRLQHW